MNIFSLILPLSATNNISHPCDRINESSGEQGTLYNQFLNPKQLSEFMKECHHVNPKSVIPKYENRMDAMNCAPDGYLKFPGETLLVTTVTEGGRGYPRNEKLQRRIDEAFYKKHFLSTTTETTTTKPSDVKPLLGKDIGVNCERFNGIAGKHSIIHSIASKETSNPNGIVPVYPNRKQVVPHCAPNGIIAMKSIDDELTFYRVSNLSPAESEKRWEQIIKARGEEVKVTPKKSAADATPKRVGFCAWCGY